MPYRLGTGQGPATLAPDHERRQPNPPRDTITQAPPPNGLPVRYRAVPASARAQDGYDGFVWLHQDGFIWLHPAIG
jgi:hypothetical protein